MLLLLFCAHLTYQLPVGYLTKVAFHSHKGDSFVTSIHFHGKFCEKTMPFTLLKKSTAAVDIKSVQLNFASQQLSQGVLDNMVNTLQ